MVLMIQRVTYMVEVHAAEEGGYWAEVHDLPGCVSQGETMEELRANILEAIEAVTEASDSDPGPQLIWQMPSQPPTPQDYQLSIGQPSTFTATS